MWNEIYMEYLLNLSTSEKHKQPTSEEALKIFNYGNVTPELLAKVIQHTKSEELNCEIRSRVCNVPDPEAGNHKVFNSGA